MIDHKVSLIGRGSKREVYRFGFDVIVVTHMFSQDLSVAFHLSKKNQKLNQSLEKKTHWMSSW
jgi:hypothetical protein